MDGPKGWRQSWAWEGRVNKIRLYLMDCPERMETVVAPGKVGLIK